ncbi:MAG TPA: DMT family transporter [Nocardioidaceae bacterium]|nr:DMT family transporter [Nocardioidaceae bacterium]
MTGRSTGALPTLALLGVTAAWGSTFFMTKDLLEQMTVLDFLSIRFAIAALALFAAAPRAVARLSRDELKHGAVLGAVYGSAQVVQTIGLDRTTASVAGFVTGMYVVLTPLLSAYILREHIDRLVWVAVVMATVGLAFLSLNGLAVSSGVFLVFVSTIGYAIHIIGLSRWSSTSNVLGLSIVQLAVSCLVASVVSAPNGIHPPTTGGGWLALVYMAVIPGSLAVVGQTWAQAHLTPTRTAIIMTMEPVFAAFFAVLFGGESLTGRMLLGGAFVLAAMYIVELAPRRHIEGEVAHLTF